MVSEVTEEKLYIMIGEKNSITELEIARNLDRTTVGEFDPVNSMLESMVKSGKIIMLAPRTDKVPEELKHHPCYHKTHYATRF